jgi:hypothetical protein
VHTDLAKARHLFATELRRVAGRVSRPTWNRLGARAVEEPCRSAKRGVTPRDPAHARTPDKEGRNVNLELVRCRVLGASAPSAYSSWLGI